MSEYPHGIFYKLSCEAAYPSISNSIEMFEEHTIIPNLNALDPKMVRNTETILIIFLKENF